VIEFDEMLPGVPVLGIIAAPDMAAGPAQAKVHPLIPRRQAFHAPGAAGRDILDTFEMRTLLAEFSHGYTPL
jgi:hypothetical protein